MLHTYSILLIMKTGYSTVVDQNLHIDLVQGMVSGGTSPSVLCTWNNWIVVSYHIGGSKFLNKNDVHFASYCIYGY